MLFEKYKIKEKVLSTRSSAPNHKMKNKLRGEGKSVFCKYKTFQYYSELYNINLYNYNNHQYQNMNQFLRPQHERLYKCNNVEWITVTETGEYNN